MDAMAAGPFDRDRADGAKSAAVPPIALLFRRRYPGWT
jgi:hypothetical protein